MCQYDPDSMCSIFYIFSEVINAWTKMFSIIMHILSGGSGMSKGIDFVYTSTYKYLPICIL